MYRNLKFFNKNGDLTNFSYDYDLNLWLGQIDLGLISVDLIESYQLFVMEDVLDVNDSSVKMTYPIKESGQLDYIVKFKNSLDEIFLYSFALDSESNLDVLQKSYESYLGLGDSNFTTISNIKNVGEINASAISINLALWPKNEDSFFNTLLICDPNNSDHVLAQIDLYGESEGEDERLTTMLNNIGLDILPTDVKIFKDSDVNEELVDWILINRKRKELLLEHANIFPYMGSYKAIINILKYFGYSNVRLKEYWQNVDETTPNFGKFKQVDIAQIFTNVADYIPKELINSKIWNKTNKFGLFYDITVADDLTDDRGTPYTKEAFTFTHDEILIKIFALKKKLQQKFLPINAKIVDIIGECVLFGTYSVGHLTSSNLITFINEEFDLNLSCPKQSGCIDDLRYLGKSTEVDVTDYTQLELSPEEIVLVKEQNWIKSTLFPNDLHVNIGFPLLLNVDLDLTWDDVKETYERIGDDTGVWNTLDLMSSWGLTELKYEVESSSKVFKYVKTLTPFNTPNLEIGVILPYVDTYSVKITYKTAQNFERVILKENFIKVEMYNADFISFYSQADGSNQWDSLRKSVQQNRNEYLDPLLKWSEMNSIWETPQHPNESIEMCDISYDHLDLLEFSQAINEDVVDPSSEQSPLIWSNSKYLTWNESDHLLWNNIGTNLISFTVFDFLDLNSANNVLMIGSNDVMLSFLDYFNSKDEAQKLEATLFTVKQLNDLPDSFGDFIYYYEPYYSQGDPVNANLIHEIRAISKKFSSNKNYLILSQIKSTFAKEMIGTGYIGDIPAYFDIYKKDTDDFSVTLMINEIMSNTNYISDNYIEDDFSNEVITSSSISLSGNIANYLDQLNNSSDGLISKFTYSLHEVKESFEDPTLSYKISAISKSFESHINYSITLSDYSNVIVTPFARPIIKNPSYQNVKLIRYTKELPPYSRVFFTHDNCSVAGIANTRWTLRNSSSLNSKDIYLNSDIISYLFRLKGSYDVTLNLTDKNGNTTETNKIELIKIT